MKTLEKAFSSDVKMVNSLWLEEYWLMTLNVCNLRGRCVEKHCVADFCKYRIDLDGNAPEDPRDSKVLRRKSRSLVFGDGQIKPGHANGVKTLQNQQQPRKNELITLNVQKKMTDFIKRKCAEALTNRHENSRSHHGSNPGQQGGNTSFDLNASISDRGDFSRHFGRDVTSAKQSRHRGAPGTTTAKKPILSALANGVSTNTIVCNIYFNQITLAKENRAADSNSMSKFQLRRTFSSRTEESVDVHIPNNKTLVTTFGLTAAQIQSLKAMIDKHNGEEIQHNVG